jgi:DNA-binding NarL/FixJ family response regulator
MFAVVQANGVSATSSVSRDSEPGRAQACSRILLIRNNRLRRECLEHLLREHLQAFAVEGVAQIAEASPQRPNIALLDLDGAKVGDAWPLEQVAQLRARFGDSSIVGLADGPVDFRSAADAIRFGYRGYIGSSVGIKIVVAAIHLVLAGGVYLPSELLESFRAARANLNVVAPPAAPSRGAAFTAREMEVLGLLRQGKPNKLIAYSLGISESTVKVHMRNIMRKLKATNRTQIAFLT